MWSTASNCLFHAFPSKMLLENGAHTDCQTAAGNTAKHLAMQLREVEIFNLIGEFDRREPTLPL